MQMHCLFCGTTDFRVSHFRLRDLRRLLFLQFPVRCRICQRRAYVPVWHILEIGQRGEARNKKPQQI